MKEIIEMDHITKNKSTHSPFTLWQLSHIANALTRARKLEKERAAFHAELYEAIRYPTVHYDHEYAGNMGSPATDVQAIRIIEAKERYERLIKHEYGRHKRWISTLESVSEKDKVILRRYFQQKKNVQPEILTAVLDRISSIIEKDELKVAEERTKRSTEEYREYRRKHPEPIKPQKEDDGRQQYLISGQFVYMTEEEYKEHQAQEEERYNLWRRE